MPKLTNEEQARVKDSKHSIEAASAALSQVDTRKIPHKHEIEECLENADRVLRGVLSHEGYA